MALSVEEREAGMIVRGVATRIQAPRFNEPRLPTSRQSLQAPSDTREKKTSQPRGKVGLREVKFIITKATNA